jgi:tetratricopeptide (TPR) repeat protein
MDPSIAACAGYICEPSSADAIKNTAHYFFQSRQFAKSAAFFKKIRLLNPADYVSMYNEGASLLLIRSIDDACNLFKHCLILAPDHAHSWGGLGGASLVIRDYYAGAVFYRRAHRLEANIPALALHAAICLAKTSRPLAAAEVLLNLLDRLTDTETMSAETVLAELSINLMAAPDSPSMTALMNRAEHKRPVEIARFCGFRYIAAVLSANGPVMATAFDEWRRLRPQDEVASINFLMRRALSNYGGYRRREPDDAKNVKIMISSLSHYGRLTHTIKNYIEARMFCDDNGYELQTPDWQGHYLFDLDDPKISDPPDLFVPCGLDTASIIAELIRNRSDASKLSIDISEPDLAGFHIAHKERIRRLLRFRPLWERLFSIEAERLMERKTRLVSLHIRLGDMEEEANVKAYGSLNFDCYRDLIDERRGDDVLIYISTDDPARVRSEFAGREFVCGDGFGDGMKIFSHLFDFYMLRRSDVVAVSRGGFARLACMLNTRASEFLQPDDKANPTALVPYDPWSGGAS